MGMYTGMYSEWHLRADVPPYVINAIRWLMELEPRTEDWTIPPHRDDHPFWGNPRAHQIGLNMCGGPTWVDRTKWPDNSPYAPDGDFYWKYWHQHADWTWTIAVSSVAKNADDLFSLWCRWISQWQVKTGPEDLPTPVGWIKYEDSDEAQTLLSDGTFGVPSDKFIQTLFPSI